MYHSGANRAARMRTHILDWLFDIGNQKKFVSWRLGEPASEQGARAANNTPATRLQCAAAHPQGSSWSYVLATVAPQTAIFIVMFGAKSFSGPQAIIEVGISLGGQE